MTYCSCGLSRSCRRTWPRSTRTTFDLAVSDNVGLGGGVEAEVPIGDSGLYLIGRIHLTIGFMSADIIDDPEDTEDGSDVNSPMHPLGIGRGVRHRFGG